MSVLRPLPSQAQLRALLDYDPETGELRWKPRNVSGFPSAQSGRSWNTRFAGKSAFATATAAGYLCGQISKREYYAHRVIWKLVHGFDPGQIDHINGVKSDNRISNLRSVSNAENGRNQRLRDSNTSGHIGVYLHECGRWCARIKVNYKTRHLGLFGSVGEAIAARRKAESEHGFHPNHGRKQA